MPANKGGRDPGGATGRGLADLKRLRKEAEAARAAARSRKEPAGALPRAGRGPSARRGGDPETLPQEDAELFRRAVKSVIRLKRSDRAVLPPVPLAPAALLAERRARAMGRDAPPAPRISDQYSPPGIERDDSSYLRPGCGPDLLRDLRRGKWPIGASLDLHGSTLDEARERLDRFLQSCRLHQLRCVRIVHGKGYGSKDGEPVLRQTIRRWLSQLEAVQAYVECSEQDGGAGAVQVLLQK
ncbi:Smr/MutS family protein [Parapusillimonas granuli]|uniref:Smr/MutS family protein n=1 Tax=Parapusillimonas granuli TaxID=380911 RepID=A0A853FYX0_9BURK|nr:Smr/MutS family protein [Parapusillimonas granuli]MBB5214947.1 DNA-nicking Smr family endonuclease [Parapusillimonas granuli]MEB2401194.1 Smr/MutS family protein [Alcaligenaceae bacterium]NYT49269.1 Smr/MutS family protein [Parapusillimonas granuli]